MLTTLFMIIYYITPKDYKTALIALIPALFFASHPSISIWAVGGLEHALLIALFSSAFVLYHKNPTNWTPSILISLVVLTRADSPILIAIFTLALFLFNGINKDNFKKLCKLISIPVAIFIAHELFRICYYGDWQPNTSRAKLAFTSKRLTDGWSYTSEFLKINLYMLIPTIALSIYAMIKKQKQIYIPLLTIILYMVYVISVGGDIFPAFRPFVIVIFLISIMLSDIAKSTKLNNIIILIALVVFSIFIFMNIKQNLAHKYVNKAKIEMWEWSLKDHATAIDNMFKDKDLLIAVDPTGSFPYFSKNQMIDTFGLTDKHIANNKPKHFGNGMLGHELGDGAYILKRKPELIYMFGGEPKYYQTGYYLRNSKAFARDYRKINIQAFCKDIEATTHKKCSNHRPHFMIYAKLEQNKIGINRTNCEINIPNYFFTSTDNSYISFDNTHPKLKIRASQQIGVKQVYIPYGKWELLAPGNNTEITLKTKNNSMTAKNSIQFSMDTHHEIIDIYIKPTHNLEINNIVLNRLDTDNIDCERKW